VIVQVHAAIVIALLLTGAPGAALAALPSRSPHYAGGRFTPQGATLDFSPKPFYRSRGRVPRYQAYEVSGVGEPLPGGIRQAVLVKRVYGGWEGVGLYRFLDLALGERAPAPEHKLVPGAGERGLIVRVQRHPDRPLVQVAEAIGLDTLSDPDDPRRHPTDAIFVFERVFDRQLTDSAVELRLERLPRGGASDNQIHIVWPWP
jgi:hypothetical protein